jgi:hypothetical protein
VSIGTHPGLGSLVELVKAEFLANETKAKREKIKIEVQKCRCLSISFLTAVFGCMPICSLPASLNKSGKSFVEVRIERSRDR